MKCKVCGKECGNYAVCFKHREKRYKDICKIHGKTTFINRQCLKCQKLKEPIYVIKNKKDRFGNKITKTHYLYPYLDRLTKLTRKYQESYIKRISKGSGIYGIFYNDVCLYVGQSVNISNRIEQHKENFKVAKYQINGTKAHIRKVNIGMIPHKVEYKYYEMAQYCNLHDLTYKTLMVIPKLKDEFEYNELLTYGEQAMIMAYKPKFNHVAARPSRKENLTTVMKKAHNKHIVSIGQKADKVDLSKKSIKLILKSCVVSN